MTLPASYRKFAYFSILAVVQFHNIVFCQMKLRVVESSSWKFIMYREQFSFHSYFFILFSFIHKPTWCRLFGARKILIWFIIGMFADICLIAIGLNAYKQRSKKDLTPITFLRLLLQLNLNLFLIRIRYVCGSSRIPSHVSPGSNCTVISFSDFLIKIYSVRCN